MKIRLQFMLGLLLIASVAVSQPTITSFAPASGPVGTAVIITGTNFSATAANNVVFFGATRAAVTAATATQLTVTVPVGATYQAITVLVGGLVAYSSKPFIVTFANGVGIDANAFAPRVNLTVVGLPESVFVGDFDGDGKADIAAENYVASSVSVLRNTGTSGTISYAAKVDFATAGNPYSVTIGDIDGDGKPDLAATNLNTSNVSVFRNTSTPGTISFAAKLEFTTGPFPQSVTIRDFDGDGKSDLAVSNGNSASVSVLRNTGTPGSLSFASKVDFAVGPTPYSVSTGDLDGDGKPEIVVANTNATVSILRNTSSSGTVSFATKVDLGAGGQPRSVSIGDIDGDGLPDLAVANSSVNTISLLRNSSTSGTISFAAKMDITASSGPYSISLGDIDGDGMIDMTVANTNSNTVSVFGNNSTIGTMAFDAKVDFATNASPQSAAIGDLDGDGKLDILAGSGGTTISVHRNTIKINQSITFGALPAKTYGNAPFALTGTSSSGLPVSYTSSNTAVATVSGNTVTIVGGGTTVITASQTGDATYAAATSVPQTLTVNKANQTISFGALSTKVFGDAAFVLTATTSSALPITYTTSNTAVATVSGNTVTIVGAGTTTITAAQTGDGNYNPATSVPQTLTVLKAGQNISFAPLPNKAFDAAAFNLTATTSSGLPISYSSGNTTVATVSGSTVTIVGVGTTSITASQPGNANYNAATVVFQNLTVVKAAQNIVFGALAAKTFGDASFTFTGSASSSLPISYTSGNTSVATVSGNSVTIVGAGVTTITASQVGNANYNAAISVPQTLTVSKANQTITFGALVNKTVGDASFALTATVSSGLSVSYSSSNTSVATISGNIVSVLSPGTTTITASQPGNSNYNPATSVQQTLSVKQNQTISFGTIPDKAFGDASFALTASSSSSLTISYASSNTAVATVIGSTVTVVGPGLTTITASQAGNASFNPAADVDQLLAVNKANQTISFGALSDKTFGDAAFTLSAMSSSSMVVNYTSSNTTVATITGSTVTILGAGVATITASQPGDANFNSATDVDQTLTVNKADQAITFGALTSKTFGDGPFELIGTSSSSLPISYSSSNTSIATVSGNTVTILGAGTTTLTASQAGDANYNSANTVSQIITLNKANQTITFNALPNKSVGDPSFALGAIASSGLTVSYMSNNALVATVSGNAVTIVGPGEAIITASQLGNANYNASGDVTQVLIVKANQAITFASIIDKTVGDAAFALTATASSSLPVSFSTSTNKITINGTQVTIESAGRATITAAQAGNANFHAAPSVNQSFCIKPAKPIVTLSNANTASPTLTSSATSGNQWFRNGVLIAGATNSTFNVTQPGIYKVQTQVDDCISVFSDDQSLIVTAIEPGSMDYIGIYPNPAMEELSIDLTGFEKNKPVSISTIDLLGRPINQLIGEGGRTIKMDVRSFTAGRYIITLQQGKSSITKSFIKSGN